MKKKERVLYVASLQLKGRKLLNGEVIKSQYICDVLRKHYRVTDINLSYHKFWQAIRLVLLSLFRKYDHYIVSKSSGGATIVLKILKRHHVPKEKITYLVIGSSLPICLERKTIDLKIIQHTNKIVVETKHMEKALKKFNLTQVETFPNFKQTFSIKLAPKTYPQATLRLIFLARVVPEKGIFDLVDVLEDLNKEAPRFKLDVFGSGDEQSMNKMKAIATHNPLIRYFGPITLNEEKDYEMISYYDLHAFPTRHLYEGVPGTLIDFFVSGVPTISSLYPNYADSLDENCAFLYPFNDVEALKEKLLYIYEHQDDLLTKGQASHDRRYKYDVKTFETYLLSLLGCDAHE